MDRCQERGLIGYSGPFGHEECEKSEKKVEELKKCSHSDFKTISNCQQEDRTSLSETMAPMIHRKSLQKSS